MCECDLCKSNRQFEIYRDALPVLFQSSFTRWYSKLFDQLEQAEMEILDLKRGDYSLAEYSQQCAIESKAELEPGVYTHFSGEQSR